VVATLQAVMDMQALLLLNMQTRRSDAS
jgi:hypothetical protein